MRLGEFYEFQLRRAMSLPEAKETLGFPPSASPSKSEIQKAYKKLALENHPDLGGDPTKMVAINVAKDVLEGKQRPSGPGGRSTSRPPTRPAEPPPKPREVIVTFEDAMRSAQVPTAGVEWKFVTEAGYGSIFNGGSTGSVAYGKSPTEHVFVAVFHFYHYGDINTPVKTDRYQMWVKRVPLRDALPKVAPQVIRELWKNFDRIKNYNAKVYLLPPNFSFTDLHKKGANLGRKLSFKQAMEQLGENVPSSWKGKVTVSLELGEEIRYPESHKLGYCHLCCRPILVVNGKEYRLSDKTSEAVHLHRLYAKIWSRGTYAYCGSSKKQLTRIRGAKKMLTIFADLCEKHREPQELIDALRAAADKAK